MPSFGKKTRNPGYKPGNNWVECQVCGFDIRAFDIKKRWDGVLVCPKDFELRHEQDFLRVPKETPAPNIVNPESAVVEVSGYCTATGRKAIVGLAVVGCAIVGSGAEGSYNDVPDGTFDNSL